MPFSMADVIEQRVGDKKPMPAKIPSQRGEFPFGNKFKTHTIDPVAFHKEVDQIKQQKVETERAAMLAKLEIKYNANQT